MTKKDIAFAGLVACLIILAGFILGRVYTKATTVKASGEEPKTVFNATLQRSQSTFGTDFEIPKKISVSEKNTMIMRLNQAIVNEDLDRVKKIISADPEIINLLNNNGEAAIHIAVTIPQNRENGIIEWLITNGSDVNLISKNVYPEWRPIYYAINNPKTVRLLIDKGADISTRDGIGRTLLHISSFRGTISQVVEYSKIYNINSTDGGGQTPLHYVCKGYGCTQERLKEYPIVLEFLVKNGADINKTDSSGYKPIYYTLLHNDNKYCHGANYEEALELLIKLGADINSEADIKNHKTPLQIAREKGLKKHEKILLQHGAKL